MSGGCYITLISVAALLHLPFGCFSTWTGINNLDRVKNSEDQHEIYAWLDVADGVVNIVLGLFLFCGVRKRNIACMNVYFIVSTISNGIASGSFVSMMMLAVFFERTLTNAFIVGEGTSIVSRWLLLMGVYSLNGRLRRRDEGKQINKSNIGGAMEQLQ